MGKGVLIGRRALIFTVDVTNSNHLFCLITITARKLF